MRDLFVLKQKGKCYIVGTVPQPNIQILEGVTIDTPIYLMDISQFCFMSNTIGGIMAVIVL